MSTKKTSPSTDISPLSGDFEQAEFESHMPYAGVGIKELSVQEEKFVYYIVSGMSIAAAGRAVGYKSPQTAYEAHKRPSIQKAVSYFRDQMREKVEFTVANAHKMYLDAYASSATATEMKNTTDSLVKLHRLVEPDNSPQITVNIANIKQLERMSDEELLSIVGEDQLHLEPVRETKSHD